MRVRAKEQGKPDPALRGVAQSRSGGRAGGSRKQETEEPNYRDHEHWPGKSDEAAIENCLAAHGSILRKIVDSEEV